MILDNWIQCTNGDFRFTRIDVDYDSEVTEKDHEEWFRIYDQYIEKYDLSDVYLKLLKIMKRKALLELEFVRTRKPFVITKLAIEEQKLSLMMKNKGTPMTIEQSLIHLAKWMGGNLINKKEITVEQYFDLLNEHGKHN